MFKNCKKTRFGNIFNRNLYALPVTDLLPTHNSFINLSHPQPTPKLQKKFIHNFISNDKVKEIEIGNYAEKIYNDQDFELDACKNIFNNEIISVIGYGPQGRGQSLNLKDNGFNAIVGVRKYGDSWNKAIKDGWEENVDLFSIEEASKRGNIIKYLLSDAAQIECWDQILPFLTKNKTLYFSHGFGIVYDKHTNISPPDNIDVILVAPKGPGALLRKKYLEGNGINCSMAVHQDYSGYATEKSLALGFGIGAKNIFETTFEKEVFSDLTGERCVLMGMIQGAFKAQYDVLRENNHSPSEAFNETVEEALVSLYPLVNDNGMDWMFENCSTTAQRGALDWSKKFYDIIKPEIEKCYESVKTGNEAKITIDANSDPNYRKNLQKELEEIKNQEVWKIGHIIRKMR